MSARSTSPTLVSAGRIEPANTPLGWRAPAARHVQVPSSRELVSSMSILRDIGMQTYSLDTGDLSVQSPEARPGKCEVAHNLRYVK